MAETDPPRTLADGDIIIDAGANAGAFSLEVAARNPGLRVLAFEPEPGLARALLRSAEARGLTNHVVHPLAIDRKDGQATLHVATGGDMGVSSLLELSPDIRARDEYWALRDDLHQDRRVEVQTRRLESVLRGVRFRDIAFIKIDVQGLDLAVLDSLGPFLPRVRAGMLELSATPHARLYDGEDDTLVDGLTFLRERGFVPYAIKPNDPATNEVNVFFARADVDPEAGERALRLRNLPIYDGKHFWREPSAHPDAANLEAALAQREAAALRLDAAAAAAARDAAERALATAEARAYALDARLERTVPRRVRWAFRSLRRTLGWP